MSDWRYHKGLPYKMDKLTGGWYSPMLDKTKSEGAMQAKIERFLKEVTPMLGERAILFDGNGAGGDWNHCRVIAQAPSLNAMHRMFYIRLSKNRSKFYENSPEYMRTMAGMLLPYSKRLVDSLRKFDELQEQIVEQQKATRSLVSELRDDVKDLPLDRLSPEFDL